MCLEILKMKLSENFMFVLLKKYSFLEYLRMVKNRFCIIKQKVQKALKMKIVNFLTIIYFTKKSDTHLIYDLTYIILNVNNHFTQQAAWERYCKKNICLKLFSFLHNEHLGLGSNPRDSQLVSK